MVARRFSWVHLFGLFILLHPGFMQASSVPPDDALLHFTGSVWSPAAADANPRSHSPSRKTDPADPPRRIVLTYLTPQDSATTIRLDGMPNETLWDRAPVMDGFTQAKPEPGRPSSQRTRSKILTDGEYLYVAVEAFDSAADSIVAPLFRRDGNESSDWVFVSVDSYMDRRTAFVFAVNPRGVQKDMKLYDNRMEDPLWDAVWEAATKIGPEGWTAEFRIPLSQLRFDATGGGMPQWGLNIAREISRTGELSFWSPTSLERDGLVSQFGVLENVGAIRPPSSMEFLPYASQQLTRRPGAASDPFHKANDLGSAVGFDLKYTFRSGLTASATVNPDFGQVEADPTQVNLTANQLFFPERRPFFLEGGDIFQFGRTQTFSTPGPPITFYSRRIGRSPSGSASSAGLDATYSDTPLQTSILGAAKLSGKLGDGWSVGVLHAFTAKETARLQLADGQRRSLQVEPAAQYAVARLKKDVLDGRGYLGGFTSLASRSLEGSYLRDQLPGSALLAGADFEARSRSRDWVVSGTLSMSSVRGSQEAIERLQRSPVRRYQRPDYRTRSVDPDRTDLTGLAGELSLQKAGGSNWLGSLTYSAVSPGYETNDMGFQNRAGYQGVHAVAIYREIEPERLQSYDVFVFHGMGWNPDGLLTGRASGFGTTLEFRNLWRLNVESFLSGNTYDDRLTRGGPISRQPRILMGALNVWSNPSKVLTGHLRLDRAANEAGERETALSAEVSWRPSARLLISLRPSFATEFDVDQYLLSVDDALATQTFGRRHVFSDIRQKVVSASFRANWTFSPTMTLETYIRPYIVSGDYEGFKEFAEPGAFRFHRYQPVDAGTGAGSGAEGTGGTLSLLDGRYRVDPDGTGPGAPFSFQDPDFTYASLQGNAVFRWEYRPGSTFYLVWQVQRDQAVSMARFTPLAEASDLFRGAGTHVVLAKVSFWM